MPFLQRVIRLVKKRKYLFAGIGILILVVSFIFSKTHQKPIIPTQVVATGNIVESVSVTGSIASRNSVNLSFSVGGTIAWVGVKKGDIVHKFQTIATLDNRTVLKNLQAALLSYADQRNTFDQTKDNNKDLALTDAIRRILDSNQNDLNKAVVSVELEDLAKQQAVLTSPIDGILTQAVTQLPGITAVAGQTLFTVTDPSSVIFSMDVDEADIGKVTNGQDVTINLDAFPDENLHAIVTNIDFVSHATANGGNAYTVETDLGPDTNTKYRIGMNGNASITIHQRNSVVVIPLSAITNDNYVYIKTSNGFKKQLIAVGLQSDTQTEVRSGLHSGDLIATDSTKVTKDSIVK